MSNWNIDKVRKIAGLEPLTESRAWGDEDDADDYEDPDAKIAASDPKQRAFERKASKDLKAAREEMDKRTADQKAKAAAKKAEAAATKPADASAEAKVNAKEEEKKSEASAEEKKRRGRAENPDGKQGLARKWMQENPNASRKEFIAHVTANHGMSPHHANTFFYAHKKKANLKSETNEMFYIQHPHAASYVLAENPEQRSFVWVDHLSHLEPIVTETKEEAEKIAKYIKEWKGQETVVKSIEL